MIKEQHVLDGESLAALADLKGSAIGFVGSPARDFRDSWRTWGLNLIIEVGNRDYTFGADEAGSELEAVAQEIPRLWVRHFKDRQSQLTGFPRYDWWRGRVVNEVLIARDSYTFDLPVQSGEIVMDRAVILVTQDKTISISLIAAHDNVDILLAHEPTISGRLGVITQPAARDLAWVDNLQHTRQIVRLEEVGGR